MQVWNVLHAACWKCRTQKPPKCDIRAQLCRAISSQRHVSTIVGKELVFRVLAALLHGTQVVGVSRTLRRWTEDTTYVRQGDHHAGLGWDLPFGRRSICIFNRQVADCNIAWRLRINNRGRGRPHVETFVPKPRLDRFWMNQDVDLTRTGDRSAHEKICETQSYIVVLYALQTYGQRGVLHLRPLKLVELSWVEKDRGICT